MKKLQNRKKLSQKINRLKNKRLRINKLIKLDQKAVRMKFCSRTPENKKLKRLASTNVPSSWSSPLL
jgi:hypothetical protein